MYVPFAFDLVRVEQEQLQRRTERTLRRSEPVTSVSDAPTGRSWTRRRLHRRPATAC